MKKRFRLSLFIFLAIILVFGSVFAIAADENPLIRSGETHGDDFITTGNTVTNDGVVLGDMIAGCQTLLSRGDVEGDILAGAYDITLNGHVGGSVRAVGNNINLTSRVDRNVMLFATNNLIIQDAVVNKNIYLFSNSISCSGSFSGDAHIAGTNVILGGIYEGDVYIDGMAEGTSFKLLPGTTIKGKLTYKGISQYQIPNDVEVGSYEYVRISPASRRTDEHAFNVWDYVKRIFTLIVYYLFALLLYKLFPRFFARTGDFIAAKPLSAAGIGIATLGSLVGGVLLLILLLILTIFIFKGAIFLFTGFLFMFVTMITVIFADIPVSLWLGKLLNRNSASVPARLAAGLLLITVLKFALDLLSNIEGISTLVGVLSFIMNAGIWVLGTGSLLKVIFEIFKSANRQAEAEETEIEPINF